MGPISALSVSVFFRQRPGRYSIALTGWAVGFLVFCLDRFWGSRRLYLLPPRRHCRGSPRSRGAALAVDGNCKNEANCGAIGLILLGFGGKDRGGSGATGSGAEAGAGVGAEGVGGFEPGEGLQGFAVHGDQAS
jgi:hypothetical protein